VKCHWQKSKAFCKYMSNSHNDNDDCDDGDDDDMLELHVREEKWKLIIVMTFDTLFY
jgi:hypothetical protein